MKINRFQIGCIAAVATFLFLGNIQAVTITLNGGTGYDLNSSSYSVGTIINGIQMGGQANRDVLMTNNLLTVAPGTFGVIDSEEYHRSNNFGALPAAVAAGAVVASGGGLNFGTNGFGAIASLTLAATYQYLVVAYDGPNGGVIVYNISSLAVGTVIEMARNAEPFGAAGSQVLTESSRYQMTGWTLLNPTQNTVPDGGATVMLLGASLGALAIGRRILLKRSSAV
jgi:hypothetical protein